MVDSRTLHRDSIKIGMTVRVSLTSKQNPAGYVSGVVKEVLTREQLDDNGIEVELTSGYIGNVKEIVDESDEEQLKQRIVAREDERVERKETFAFVVHNSRKKPDLKKVLVQAVASLINNYGGYVYVGVTDEGIVQGLERDYKIMKGKGNNDAFERQVRDALRKYLTDYAMVSRLVSFSFPRVFGHEICEIRITPSKEPAFMTIDRRDVCINGNRTTMEFDDFYMRDGNGKKLLTNRELVSYYRSRFLNS